MRYHGKVRYARYYPRISVLPSSTSTVKQGIALGYIYDMYLSTTSQTSSQQKLPQVAHRQTPDFNKPGKLAHCMLIATTDQ